LLVCFAAALFVSAFLLFLVQPMVAKMVLPLLGGAPAVWATCMLFFQAALVAGYAYAHLTPNRLGSRRHLLLHLWILALPLLVLPIGVRDWEFPADRDPVLWLLALLTMAAGLPFFVVATSAPLLQRWFADTGHRHARDPYFLYAASNLGSMLALLAYPVLIEPHFRLAEQSLLWSEGYLLFLVLTACCAWLLVHSHPHTVPIARPAEDPSTVRPSWFTRLRWLALAFVPSSLLLGVTTYISTDVAAIPLLWIVPLALYLLTFILAFSRLDHWLQPMMVPLLAGAILVLIRLPSLDPQPGWATIIPIHLGAFFVAGMVCHGELARTRPDSRYLTEFYLWIALGGVIGGVFNALIAPLIFDRIFEYPLVIVLACLLCPGFRRQASCGTEGQPGPFRRGIKAGWLITCILFGGICGWFLVRQYEYSDSDLLIHQNRNFFGVRRVSEDRHHQFHYLTHGTTLHGLQNMQPDKRVQPLSYYHLDSPIGQVFEAFEGPSSKTTVAVVGLGSGTLAAYADAGEHWDFYEIDRAVERIASDPRYFTYLQDAHERGAAVQVILGDARQRLNDAGDSQYGLIIMDAFSSDAIPVHLLTREALHLYLKKLKRDGIVAFHISNKYLTLEPVLAKLASEAGLVCFSQDQDDLSQTEDKAGKYTSQWVLVARADEDLGKIVEDARWHRSVVPSDMKAWTDDYSNLLSVFVWK
jgi:hypothetical protein